MAESKVECYRGVKTAKAEGRRCSWGDPTLRKTRRMHSETASNQRSEENVHILLIFSLETSCLWYSTKCQLGVPEVICKATQQLACLVIIQGGYSTCPSKQSHKCARAAQFGSQAITLFRKELLAGGRESSYMG